MESSVEKLDWSNWKRVLVVVAHPDDAEYGLSAAVHHWTNAGVEVSYLLLTNGQAGMQRPPEEAGRVRAEEQRHACEAVGVSDLMLLNHPDGHLVYGLDLRRDIARRIRRLRPDAVITTNFDLEAPWGLNQADHRAAGLAAVDAVRDAGNRWVFREQIEQEGLETWHVGHILVAGHGAPTHGTAVGQADRDAAVASLECHTEYLADLPDHPAPADFLPEILAADGALLGADFGVTFRVYAN
ncbi:PIG-L deacetylase family protein [Corynebacterium halotolerans]|uniref:LmbE family protein n=1 Tax=Corynebacterium halotolerans YIM 70093 = DSM 44683 TaxID=1121362 RepID=M1MWH0_9CORY|nr:PIG-L deacetylase family protein [Corynebacterium halotolerans]AGF72079.1 hypothetical protein A605_05365 [Corynebacterium halotolerans YIM 70093 = DSM 44683]